MYHRNIHLKTINQYHSNRLNKKGGESRQIQLFLIYSQKWALINTIEFKNIGTNPKRNPIPISIISHFPTSPAPANHLSTFCLCGFAYSGHIIYMKPRLFFYDLLLSLAIMN